MQIKVMSFNIWLGGTQVDFSQVITAIEAAEADIIGIQEPRQNLPALAEALRYHYDADQKVLSRYPLVAPSTGPRHYVFAQVAPGKAVAVANVHLRAFPYTPYMLRDGGTVQNALEAEQYHVSEITPTLHALRPLAAAGMPVFLTGDFNVPSHLDWTEATTVAAGEPFRTVVPWPVSVQLDDSGFRDSFREMHPDPVARPGITWSPGYPVPHVDADDVLDRIDFVYAAGPSVTTASQVVGEGGPHTDIAVTPWPSDHRAVVSTFNAVPSPMPMNGTPGKTVS